MSKEKTYQTAVTALLAPRNLEDIVLEADSIVIVHHRSCLLGGDVFIYFPSERIFHWRTCYHWRTSGHIIMKISYHVTTGLLLWGP